MTLTALSSFDVLNLAFSSWIRMIPSLFQCTFLIAKNNCGEWLVLTIFKSKTKKGWSKYGDLLNRTSCGTPMLWNQSCKTYTHTSYIYIYIYIRNLLTETEAEKLSSPVWSTMIPCLFMAVFSLIFCLETGLFQSSILLNYARSNINTSLFSVLKYQLMRRGFFLLIFLPPV